ncbi:MAG: CDP-glycerol glycerophosphotransferase family protein [Anaerorhabdus sp.]
MKSKLNIRKKALLIPSAGFKNALDDILPIEEQLNEKFDCLIAVKDIDNEVEIIGNITFVKLNSAYYDYLVASSEYVFDCGQLQSIRKVFSNSCWVNLWHGIPIKKMMVDLPKPSFSIINNYRYFDYFVSPSKYYTNILRNSFLYEGKVLETGSPRYDFAFVNQSNNLKERLHIKENEKVILYAPTFRRPGKVNIPFEINKIEELFGGPVKIIVKAHYLNELSLKSSGVIDMTDYSSISDLFEISDLVISDYSSLIFDYALHHKPLILFHYDYEQYKSERGFYFELSDYYSKIAYNKEDLYSMIKKIKKTDHTKLIKDFLPLEKGGSCKKLISKLNMDDTNYDMEEVIFLVNQLDEIGGVHTFIKQTAKALKNQANVKVVVIATTKKYKTNMSNKEFQSEHIDIKITDIKIARNYLKSTNGFIVATQVYALKIFQNDLKNKNTIAMFHGDVKFANTDKTIYNNEIRDLACNNIHNIKSIVLLSGNNTKYFKELISDKRRVSTIPNYINSQEQNVEPKGNVMFISRLANEDKNIFKLIDVAKELKKLNCKQKIDIYGTGKDQQELERMIKENKLTSILKLKGYTEKPIKEFKKHSINLCLSNTEGLPYTVLEAASVGVPTIGINSFLSASDIINKDLLVEKRNYEEVANLINNLSSKKSLLIKYSNWSYKLSKEYYEKNIIKLWFEEFETLDKISVAPKETLMENNKVFSLRRKIKNFTNSIVNSNFRHDSSKPTSSSLVKVKSQIYYLLGKTTDIFFGNYLRKKNFLIDTNGQTRSLQYVKDTINEEDTVSIVVPCYNVEKTVNRTIKSILKQTYKDIEIILINDGSTDNTKNVVESYKDKRIRHITTKNQGLSLTRNRGLIESSGKYLMFVDGDDTIEKNAIETLYYTSKYLAANIVSGKTLRVPKKKLQLIKGKYWRKPLFDVQRTVNVSEENQLMNDALSTNKLYRKSIFEKYDLKFKKMLYEDKLFTSELYNTEERVLILNRHVYNWFIYEHDTISTTYTLDNLKKRCESVERQLESVSTSELKTIVIKKFLSHDMLIFQKVIHTFEENEKNECFKVFIDFMSNKWDKIDITSFESGFTYITSLYLYENRKKEYISTCEKFYN